MGLAYSGLSAQGIVNISQLGLPNWTQPCNESRLLARVVPAILLGSDAAIHPIQL
jgi:hypothetical protein